MNELRLAVARLTRYEKISAVLLALFGVGAVVLGLVQMRTRILTGGERPNKAAVAVRQPAIPFEEQMKKEDTDKDGLSDFEEINSYKTSPYLQDSDSDGATDAEEVAAGENPNCPKGETCFNLSQSAQAYEEGQGVDAAPIATPELSTPEAQILGMFGSGSSFDAKTLREALRSAGVSDDALEKVDDATLKKMYEETVGTELSAPAPAAPKSASNAASTPAPQVSPQQMADLIPLSEIRAVLLQAGLSKEEVDALSEEELRALVAEATKQLEEQQ